MNGSKGLVVRNYELAGEFGVPPIAQYDFKGSRLLFEFGTCPEQAAVLEAWNILVLFRGGASKIFAFGGN